MSYLRRRRKRGEFTHEEQDDVDIESKTTDAHKLTPDQRNACQRLNQAWFAAVTCDTCNRLHMMACSLRVQCKGCSYTSPHTNNHTIIGTAIDAIVIQRKVYIHALVQSHGQLSSEWGRPDYSVSCKDKDVTFECVVFLLSPDAKAPDENTRFFQVDTCIKVDHAQYIQKCPPSTKQLAC